MESAHTITTDVNVADTVWNILSAGSSSERWFYLAIAVIVALIAIWLAIYAIKTIRNIHKENTDKLSEITKNFTDAIAEQRKDFLQHLK